MFDVLNLTHFLPDSTDSTDSTDQHTLVLTAHGVDYPGTEITKDLRSMLQSKLNATALTTISNLVSASINVVVRTSGILIEMVVPV